MFQVIGPVVEHIGKDRAAAEPLADEFVQAPGFKHRAMRCFVHQDPETELAGADDDDGEDEGQRIRPDRKNGKSGGLLLTRRKSAKCPPKVEKKIIRKKCCAFLAAPRQKGEEKE